MLESVKVVVLNAVPFQFLYVNVIPFSGSPLAGSIAVTTTVTLVL